MSVGNKQILLEAQVVAADGTTKGSTIDLPPFAKDFIVACEVSSRTDGTYTLTVEHSPDGTNWFTLGAVAAISSNIMSIKVVTTQSFHHVRSSLLAASTTSGATIECTIWYQNTK